MIGSGRHSAIETYGRAYGYIERRPVHYCTCGYLKADLPTLGKARMRLYSLSSEDCSRERAGVLWVLVCNLPNLRHIMQHELQTAANPTVLFSLPSFLQPSSSDGRGCIVQGEQGGKKTRKSASLLNTKQSPCLFHGPRPTPAFAAPAHPVFNSYISTDALRWHQRAAVAPRLGRRAFEAAAGEQGWICCSRGRAAEERWWRRQRRRRGGSGRGDGGKVRRARR
ncbi:hypothetical protein MPH_11818 [Macrophomina phaseolina MS6]|uniref:Uncharacterized protein n=1 Tax=Macrophomina phaseolina (strain MS6) TaxID=1126212 RepID=K2S309_MACPH|nr:hypothetical protein MPH_11818 [Macrophomina phaseolina MS6]